jgi:hypothetical protein
MVVTPAETYYRCPACDQVWFIEKPTDRQDDQSQPV